MVALPLLKLGSLVLRQFSKYGANWIKNQAHDHPKFRKHAARYGQVIHQVNMRMQVSILRDKRLQAEKRAREKAEAPTVKTVHQTIADQAKEKQGAAEQSDVKESEKIHHEDPPSIWRRKFKPLSEDRAVDLFADIIGEAFILFVAVGLFVWVEKLASRKPDANAERIAALKEKEDELEKKQQELQEAQSKQQARVDLLEQALEESRKAGQKKISWF